MRRAQAFHATAAGVLASCFRVIPRWNNGLHWVRSWQGSRQNTAIEFEGVADAADKPAHIHVLRQQAHVAILQRLDQMHRHQRLIVELRDRERGRLSSLAQGLANFLEGRFSAGF